MKIKFEMSKKKEKLDKIVAYLTKLYCAINYLIENNKDFCFHSIVGYDVINHVSYDGEYYYITFESKKIEYEKYDSMYIEGNNIYFVVEIKDNEIKLKAVNNDKKIKVGDKVSYVSDFNPYGKYETLKKIFYNIKNSK